MPRRGALHRTRPWWKQPLKLTGTHADSGFLLSSACLHASRAGADTWGSPGLPRQTRSTLPCGRRCLIVMCACAHNSVCQAAPLVSGRLLDCSVALSRRCHAGVVRRAAPLPGRGAGAGRRPERVAAGRPRAGAGAGRGRGQPGRARAARAAAISGRALAARAAAGCVACGSAAGCAAGVTSAADGVAAHPVLPA
jgi:hypothetical protein